VTVRVLVAAQPVLDRGASRGQLDALRPGLGQEQVDCVEQRRAALVELAERAQRSGERHSHVDLAVAVRAGDQPQGRLEPARRHRWRAWGRLGAARSSSAMACSSPGFAACSTW